MAKWRRVVRVGDVFHDDDVSLKTKAEVIVERLRTEDDYDLDELLEELVDAGQEDDERWFNLVWNAIYDWADAERVWIDTMSPSRG